MDGLDYLGAEEYRPPLSLGRSSLALGVGVLGAFLFRKHPVLAFLSGAAVASNVHAVVTRERTPKDALQRMGRHVIAVAGSLSLPAHPAIGYVAGAAVAADLLIDGDGGGIIDEFVEYEGIRDRVRKDVVDAEYTEVKPSTALAKRGM